MTHTPGPWFVGKMNADYWRRVGPTAEPENNEPAIAFVYGFEPSDAHLIAAAPDLLAALKDLQAQLGTDPALPGHITQMALDAIAKAEGRS